MSPVLTAGRVRRLRCAFQFLFGYPAIMSQAKSYNGCVVYEVCMVGGDESCINCVREFVSVGLLPKPRCCDLSYKAPPKPKPTGADDSAQGIHQSIRATSASGTSSAVATNSYCEVCNTLDKDGCYLGECPPGHWLFKSPNAANQYKERLEHAMIRNFPQGWFCVGDQHEAKQAACMYGADCDACVWTIAGKEDDFARFTMTILALATLDPAPEPAPQTLNLNMKFAKDSIQGALSDLGAMEARVAVVGEREQESNAQLDTMEQALREQVRGAFENLPGTFDRATTPEQLQPLAERTVNSKGRALSIVTQPKISGPQLTELKGIIDSLDVAINTTRPPQAADERQRLNALVAPARDRLPATRAAVDNLINARLQAGIRTQRDATTLIEDVAKRAQAAGSNLRDASTTLNSAATSLPQPTPDAFSRPGSMPLSHPIPGIEFQPSAPVQ